MNISALIAALFFLSIFASCAKIETVENNLPKDSHKKILEISSDFQGLWWMNGKVLDFRLYDDGSAEYDEYHRLRSGV